MGERYTFGIQPNIFIGASIFLIPQAPSEINPPLFIMKEAYKNFIFDTYIKKNNTFQIFLFRNDSIISLDWSSLDYILIGPFILILKYNA